MPRMAVNSSHHGLDAPSEDLSANLQHSARSWYFTKDEIDNGSPSRKDGIDRVRESSLRKSYCSFLKDLGMKLRVSPVTTATATMFCHRFYMHQSHAKNDWQTIATACMFLACKAEDNLRPLRDVTIVAYEMIYKWDPSAPERIRQREVYQKQKELILDAEHLLLVTIAFDICIKHPFRPLVDALKRLKISNNEVAKVAWNLVNEWLRTTICLQYKPHYIAAASLSVAAKLLNFTLPTNEGKAWWMQFDVSPKQLEEVTQQMLRYFKHDEKQKAPQAPTNLMKTTAAVKTAVKVEASTSQSAQSCVLSELTVGSDPKGESIPTRGRPQEPSLHQSGLNGTAKNSCFQVREASEHQSSDCCSGISSVMDSEGAHASSRTAHVDTALCKVDVDRLKGAFERARQVKRAKAKDGPVPEGDMDSDLLIERVGGGGRT
uniref:Cyclin-like domain-containing protein n=1 Tax=Opuntia streptacantha TaxID=393608 RepID=A0A7C9E0Q7_OPUST